MFKYSKILSLYEFFFSVRLGFLYYSKLYTVNIFLVSSEYKCYRLVYQIQTRPITYRSRQCRLEVVVTRSVIRLADLVRRRGAKPCVRRNRTMEGLWAKHATSGLWRRLVRLSECSRLPRVVRCPSFPLL